MTDTRISPLRQRMIRDMRVTDGDVASGAIAVERSCEPAVRSNPTADIQGTATRFRDRARFVAERRIAPGSGPVNPLKSAGLYRS